MLLEQMQGKKTLKGVCANFKKLSFGNFCCHLIKVLTFICIYLLFFKINFKYWDLKGAPMAIITRVPLKAFSIN